MEDPPPTFILRSELLVKRIESALPKLLDYLSDQDLIDLRQMPYDRLVSQDFWLCTWVRIKLLRHKSVLYKTFVREGIDDVETMSRIVLHVFYHELHPEEMAPA